MGPARLRSFLSNLCSLFSRECLGSRVPALEAPFTPQRHGRRVLPVVRLGQFDLSRGEVGHELGELVYVPGALA